MAFSNIFRRRSLPIFFIALGLLVVLAVQNAWPGRAAEQPAANQSNLALSGLDSSSAFERANAVKALRVTHDTAAVPALLNHLNDSDQAVGLYVAQALGELTPESNLPALRSALQSPSADVRWRAAYALGALRDAQAVNGLAARLQDPEVVVQSQAADALAQIGNRNAIDALVAALASPQASVAHVSMAALEKIGEPAVAALAAATGSTVDQVRLHAVTVLGYIATPQALPALQLAVVDPNPDVRAEAEWALVQIVRPQAGQ